MGRRAAARLAYSVVVNDADGNPVTITPNEDVPDWAVDQIHDHCYADDGAAATGEGDGGPPPKAGRGSGKDAWSAYADSVEVTVDGEATRDDIIAAIEAAGHPVE